MMSYFLIHRYEDNVHTAWLTKDQLEKWLKEEDHADYDFLKSMPDIEYFPSRSVFIIKGEIVVPKQGSPESNRVSDSLAYLYSSSLHQ